MSKDLYSEMCVHFGIDSLKKIRLIIVEIALLTDMVKQTNIIYVKCCADPVRFAWLYFCCVCLISVRCIYSFILCYQIRW